MEVWELVPGDLVVLNAGEKAPGDGELLDATKLSVDEAILTGESEPVNKHAVQQTVAEMPSSGRGCHRPQSQVFMGTTVVPGGGFCCVTKTGTRTELGVIATQLERACRRRYPAAGATEGVQQNTDLHRRVGYADILIVGLLMGREFLDMLRTSIILAIAACPKACSSP